MTTKEQAYSISDTRKLVNRGFEMENQGKLKIGLGQQFEAFGILKMSELLEIREVIVDKDGNETVSGPLIDVNCLSVMHCQEHGFPRTENDPNMDKDIRGGIVAYLVTLLIPAVTFNDPKNKTYIERDLYAKRQANVLKLRLAIKLACAMAYAGYSFNDFDMKRGFHVDAYDVAGSEREIFQVGNKSYVKGMHVYLDNSSAVFGNTKPADTTKAIAPFRANASVSAFMTAQKPSKSNEENIRPATLQTASAFFTNTLDVNASYSKENLDLLVRVFGNLSKVLTTNNRLRSIDAAKKRADKVRDMAKKGKKQQAAMNKKNAA